MGNIDGLIHKYEERIALPWSSGLSASERVLFAVYDKEDERRLRARIGAFELSTRKTGHGWASVDLTDSFAEWMSSQKRREDYFRNPGVLQPVLKKYESFLVERITEAITDASLGPNDILAVVGAGSLFGLTFVSQIVEPAALAVPGKMLVFFPGHREGNDYCLLDARHGWNYLAVPITA